MKVIPSDFKLMVDSIITVIQTVQKWRSNQLEDTTFLERT